MERDAGAYLYRGKLYLHPQARTTTGLMLAWGPVRELTPSGLAEIGDAIAATLVEAVGPVHHPGFRGENAYREPVTAHLGLKSWATLARKSRYVGVRSRDGQVVFTSYRYEGRGGSVPVSTSSEFPIEPPEALGRALLDAFEACTQDD